MAEIVDKSRTDGDFRSVVVELFELAGENVPESSCSVKYSKAMSETRVCGTREDQVREAELPYAAQSLELGAIKKTPDELLESSLTKFDEVVNRVSKSL